MKTAYRHMWLIYGLMRDENNRMRSLIKSIASVVFRKEVYFNNKLWWLARGTNKKPKNIADLHNCKIEDTDYKKTMLTQVEKVT